MRIGADQCGWEIGLYGVEVEGVVAVDEEIECNEKIFLMECSCLLCGRSWNKEIFNEELMDF